MSIADKLHNVTLQEVGLAAKRCESVAFWSQMFV